MVKVWPAFHRTQDSLFNDLNLFQSGLALYNTEKHEIKKKRYTYFKIKTYNYLQITLASSDIDGSTYKDVSWIILAF